MNNPTKHQESENCLPSFLPSFLWGTKTVTGLQIGHDTLLYFCLQRFFYNPIPVLSIQGRERERERDLNNKPGFPFRKGTLLSSSWKSASNPAKVSSDLLCFWLPLLPPPPPPPLLLLYLAIIMHMELIHQLFMCGWSVFVGFGYYYPRVKKSSFIYIYIKNSLLLATWVVAHLKQILTSHKSSPPPSRTAQVCITIMERCRKLSWVLQISDFVTPVLLTPSQFEEQVITSYSSSWVVYSSSSSSSSLGMREDLLSMIAPPHTWVSVGTSTTCM